MFFSPPACTESSIMYIILDEVILFFFEGCGVTIFRTISPTRLNTTLLLPDRITADRMTQIIISRHSVRSCVDSDSVTADWISLS